MWKIVLIETIMSLMAKWINVHFHNMFKEAWKVVTMLGIELATFKLEVQLFNHYSKIAPATNLTSEVWYGR